MIGKSVTGAVCCVALLVVAGLPLGAQEPMWLGGHTDVVRCVAVLPDGRAISGGDDDVVKIWNIASEELLMTLEGHEDAVRSVAVTPDGRIVSATGAEARVWNSVSGACLRVIADDCAPVAVTGDGLLIAHARGNPHALRVRDLNTESAPRDLTWDTESGVGPIAVTRDGRVVSAHDNGEMRVWDPKTGTCERTLKWDVGTRPSTLATSPDWRLRAGAGADVRAACGDQDGRIYVWDLQTGTLQKEWKTEMGPVSALAFLPDGRLVSAGSNLSLYVWDPATGKRLQTVGTSWASLYSPTAGLCLRARTAASGCGRSSGRGPHRTSRRTAYLLPDTGAELPP